MKVASLFTGCGGLDLGLEQAGHEIILQCECDPGAQQVLRKAFPGVLLVPDVCGLDRLPKETELVAAGFPCIDVSRAGLRQGLEGPSTSLVKHVFRLLARARHEHRPVPWVLLENVEALLDRAHGAPPAVTWVVQQLEELGYRSWAQRIICSAGFGVPNRRRRVFIVASMNGDARDVLLGQGLHRCVGSCLATKGGDCWECWDPDDNTGRAAAAAGAAAGAAGGGAGGDGKPAKPVDAHANCSYALDLGNARSSAGVDVVPTFTTSNCRICLLLSSGRYGMLRIEDAERLQGLPPGHTAPCYPISLPGVRQHRSTGRDHDADTAARARFALLGNAVTVQVAQWLGERLHEPYRYKYSVTDNDMPVPRHQQPQTLTDEAWEELREVRIDHLRCEGAAGGVARLVLRSNGKNDNNNNSGGGGGLAPGDADEEQEEAAAGAGGDSTTTPAEADAGAGKAAGGEAGAPGGGSAAAAAGAEVAEAAAAAAAAVAAASALRYKSGRLNTSWPRAAWFLAGQGRWGLKQVSDTPIKARFVPLGEFITRVGPTPPDVAMVIYLQRLKEQGWNVERTERKMVMCGVPGIAGGANSQSGLAGLMDSGDAAASSIGKLVWAALPLGRSNGADSAAAAAAAAPAAQLNGGGGRGGSPGAAVPGAAAGGGAGGGGGASSSDVVWWPCEAIDPFDPPRGFVLLPEHKLALSAEERRLHLPAAQGAPAVPAAAAAAAAAAAGGSGSGSGDGGGTPPDSTAGGDAAAAAAAAAGRPAAGAAGVGPPGRKLLLMWFHQGGFEWRDGSELLPFRQNKQRLKAATQALIDAGRLTRPQDWKQAYQEAKHCNTILARASKASAGDGGGGASSSDGGGGDDSSEEGDEHDQRAAVAGRAAKQALAVNLSMPRCKACEACTQTAGTASRRCLLVRATAAAAAGHGGAQLSVLGDKAIGADIDVWWPLDQAWYKGVISAYDRLRVRHTVNYEDGDVEIIPLWAPQQRIRLRSQPAQWVAKAAQLAAQAAAAQRELGAARATVAGAAGLPDQPNGAPLTAMEQERLSNIQRNKAKMAALMAAAGYEPLDPADAGAAGGAAGAAAGAAGGGAAASAAAAALLRGAAPAAGPPTPAGGGGEGGGGSKTMQRSSPGPAAADSNKSGGGGGGVQHHSGPHAAAGGAAAAAAAPPRLAVKAEPGTGQQQQQQHHHHQDGQRDASQHVAAVAAAAAGAGAAGPPQGWPGKRMAACLAGFKIRDQVESLSVRLPPLKKRKRAPPGTSAAAAAAAEGMASALIAGAAAAAALGGGGGGAGGGGYGGRQGEGQPPQQLSRALLEEMEAAADGWDSGDME